MKWTIDFDRNALRLAIIKIDFDKKWVCVDKIDFRGKVYKK